VHLFSADFGPAICRDTDRSVAEVDEVQWWQSLSGQDCLISTLYHANYLARELTKRGSADNAEKLSQSLCNATVDLNPHQVEAALFAFRSPLSRGAVLADEVGLGKTIEAGLIISQLWAEKKRRVL